MSAPQGTSTRPSLRRDRCMALRSSSPGEQRRRTVKAARQIRIELKIARLR
jgi:hypothetical protein